MNKSVHRNVYCESNFGNLDFHTKEIDFYFVGNEELWKVLEQGNNVISAEKVGGTSRKLGWSRERVPLAQPSSAPEQHSHQPDALFVQS